MTWISSVTDQAQDARALVAAGCLAQSGDLTDQQRLLLAACDTPRRQTELMALLGVTHQHNSVPSISNR